MMKVLAFVAVLGFAAAVEENKNDATVLILGAGVAGIQAAATLTQQGITDFLIIEQAGRIGGRMWQEEWAGLTVELGCNWIEGTPLSENPLWTIAQEINLQGHTTHVEDHPTMYDSNGKEENTVAASVWARLDAAMAYAYKTSIQRQFNDRRDISLRDALTDGGWKPTTPMEKVAEFFYVEWNFEYGAEDVSLFNFFDGVGAASSQATNFTSISSAATPRRIPKSKLRRGMPRNVYAALKERSDW